MLCHGQGDVGTGAGASPDGTQDAFYGGCCWVDGEICPNRWFIDWDGTYGPPETIYDHNRVSHGTVTAYATELMPGGGPNKAARVQRVVDQVRNVIYACKVPILNVGLDPSLINDPAAFEAAWFNHADYQAIADKWEAHRRPRNWCQIFGPSEGQCCFAEDPLVNDAKASRLSEVAVTIRSTAPGKV